MTTAAKMSKIQRHFVLSRNEHPANRGVVTAPRTTADALTRHGWAIRADGYSRTVFVTFAGFLAAGFDMDAVHTQALAEYREVARAARQADSAAYQRELARELDLNVAGDPATIDPDPIRPTDDTLSLDDDVNDDEQWDPDDLDDEAQRGKRCPVGHEIVLTVGGTCADCEQPEVPAEVAPPVGVLDDLNSLRGFVKHGPDTVREASDMLLALDRIEQALRASW